MKIKRILALLGTAVLLASCSNGNANKEVFEALQVEYNVTSGEVSEFTEYEWEDNTTCYKVVSNGNVYYVAIMENGTDADNDLDTFLTLHRKDKR